MSSVVRSTSSNSYLIPYSTSDLIGGENSVYTANKTSSGSSGTSATSSSGGSYSQNLVSQMSGLDVGSLVNQMLAPDQTQLDQLYAKQQKTQWTQDRYRSVIGNLSDFSNQYFDMLNSDYVLSANSFALNSASPSSSALTATVSNSARTGTYTVTSATLATASNITTSVASKPSASAAISTMGVTSGAISYELNGKSLTYNLNSNESISDVMQDLSLATGYNFNYSELTGNFSITDGKTGESQNIDIQNINDNTGFFNAFGLNNVSAGGAIATTDTARIDGSGIIKNTAASASDKILNTSLVLTNGNTLSFTINGTPETYAVDTSKSVDTLMSDLSSLTGGSTTFSYNSSTGKISAKSGGSNLSISYAAGSSAQAFFNNAFGETLGSTSITSAAGTAEVDGNSVVENPTKNADASSADGISATNLPLTNGNVLSFTVNGATKSYTVDTSKSVSTLMSGLSSATGLKFSYDSSTGKVNVESTGSQNLNISYAAGSSAQTFFNDIFGETSGTTSVSRNSYSSALGTGGTDGSFTIKEPGDSVGTTVTEASNSFAIDGVSYNITSNITSDSPATLTVSTNVDSAVSKIEDFVNSYNSLISGIQSVVGEKTDFNYGVLTYSQEQGMTSDQIASWNQKAQQGVLANDDLLTGFLTSMREAFYTKVKGVGISMNDIGLSTSDNISDGGKITINDAALKSALQSNPNKVISLLTNTSSSVPGYSVDLTLSQRQTRSSEEGIFQRLSDIVEDYSTTDVNKYGEQGKLVSRAGISGNYLEDNSTIYKELKDETDSITNFKVKMSDDKKMYTTKFTALQTALSSLTTQSSYLSSMLGSSSNS